MCRFLAYKGREMLMSDLLVRAEQSLILQSYKAREREEPLNGDGFGVGWYTPEIDPTPCVFTSTQPAWSNRNLFRLSEKIRSTCFFAHVRAASKGAYVSEFNCHPFQFKQFLWMHNGKIADFPKIKRNIRESLQDEYYNYIEGTTDSEHAFAVFLDYIDEHINDYSINDICEAMVATIHKIEEHQHDADIQEVSHLNFAFSDGHTLVVSRYATNPDIEPPTLYIATGERIEIRDDRYHMTPSKEHADAIVIASEPLTAERSEWKKVEKNSLVIVTPELHVRQEPIN